jgi:hypothetical protein
LVLREGFLKCPPTESILNSLHYRVGLFPKLGQLPGGFKLRLSKILCRAPLSGGAESFDPLR